MGGGFIGRNARYGEPGIFDLDDAYAALNTQVRVTLTHNAVISGTGLSYSSVDLGDPSDDRFIVVGGGIRFSSGSVLLTGATIDGTSLTALASEVNNGANTISANLFMLPWPEGKTATVALTTSGGSTAASGIAVWAMRGNILRAAASNIITSMNTTSPGGSLNVPAKGAAIGYLFGLGNGAARTSTWTGITEWFDQTVSGSNQHSGASEEFATGDAALSVGITFSGSMTSVSALFASFR